MFEATLLPKTRIQGEKISRNILLARQVVYLQKVKDFDSVLTILLALIKGLINLL